MKKQIIIIVFLISSSFPAIAGSNWELVDSVRWRGHGSIHGFDCADSLNCMYFELLKQAGGFLIRRTTDGGFTWSEVFKDSAYIRSTSDYHLVPDLNDIQYPNTKLCIAVGDSGLILHSTDKGETWDVSRLDTFSLLHGILFYDENIGFMFAYHRIKGQSTWYSTTDGGENWELIDYSLKEDRILLSRIEYIERDIIGGGASKKGIPYEYLFYAYNNFESIDTIPNKPFPDDLSFSGRDSCWLAGGKDLDPSSGERWTQEIYRTTNGGYTWEKQRDTVFNLLDLHDVEFYDHQFGMAAGKFALILITEDGGKNWKEEQIVVLPPSGSTEKVDHIQIASRNTAFVVLDRQYVYKWTRPPVSVEEFADNEFVITPNPASNFIEINNVILRNEVTKNPFLSVKVFDVLGNVVVSEFKTHPPTPSHEGEMRIDVSQLNPGIYFIKVGGKVSKFVKI